MTGEWFCTLCFYANEDISVVTDHLNTEHTPRSNIRCGLCGEAYTNILDLESLVEFDYVRVVQLFHEFDFLHQPRTFRFKKSQIREKKTRPTAEKTRSVLFTLSLSLLPVQAILFLYKL